MGGAERQGPDRRTREAHRCTDRGGQNLQRSPEKRWFDEQQWDRAILQRLFRRESRRRLVDTGMACFADTLAATQFVTVVDEFYALSPQGNYYDDVLAAYFQDHEDWCEFTPSAKTPHLNLLIFSTGFGDGLYSSYWGLDKSGNRVCLLVDFQTFDQGGSLARE